MAGTISGARKKMMSDKFLRITTQAKETKKELEILKSGSIEEQRKLALKILADWGVNKESKSPKTSDEIILWKFSVKNDKGVMKKAITIMREVLWQGAGNLEKLAQVSAKSESTFQKIKRYIKE